MKKNNRNLICLSILLSLMFFGSIFSQGLYAQQKVSKKEQVTYSKAKINTHKIKNKKSKTKAVIYPNKKSKTKGITYPDIISNTDLISVIYDEEDAQDYLFDFLSNMKKYNLNKNTIEIEDLEEFPFASDVEEWYFGYGPKTDYEFIPSKYFAVTEEGDIFEYNFEKDCWFLIPIVYKK